MITFFKGQTTEVQDIINFFLHPSEFFASEKGNFYFSKL